MFHQEPPRFTTLRRLRRRRKTKKFRWRLFEPFRGKRCHRRVWRTNRMRMQSYSGTLGERTDQPTPKARLTQVVVFSRRFFLRSKDDLRVQQLFTLMLIRIALWGIFRAESTYELNLRLALFAIACWRKVDRSRSGSAELQQRRPLIQPVSGVRAGHVRANSNLPNRTYRDVPPLHADQRGWLYRQDGVDVELLFRHGGDLVCGRNRQRQRR